MSLYKMYKRDRAMDADAIEPNDFRAALGCRGSIVKRLARALSAPTATARRLIYEGVWPSRRREVALVLADQIEQEMKELALVKSKLERILEDIDAVDRRENNKGAGTAIKRKGKDPGRESAQIERASGGALPACGADKQRRDNSAVASSQ